MTVLDLTSRITSRYDEIKADPDLFLAPEVAHLAGCSHRQVDYWARCGLIPGQPKTLGSGNPRAFTHEQVAFVAALARLVRVGFEPRAMAEALQDHTTDGVLPTVLPVGDGVEIHLRPLPAASAQVAR